MTEGVAGRASLEKLVGFSPLRLALIARSTSPNGDWYPRGGIPIDVFWQSGPAPEGLWLPDQGVPPYRGRG